MKQAMKTLTSMETVEWFTPPWLIDNIVRPMLDWIALDPCSPDPPPPWIQAENIYTPEINGLTMPWYGRTFVNPPYDQTQDWIQKAEDEIFLGNTLRCLVLVNSAPGYVWFERVWRRWPVLLFRDRIKFYRQVGGRYEEAPAAAKKGQALILMCPAYQYRELVGRLEAFGAQYGVVSTFNERGR